MSLNQIYGSLEGNGRYTFPGEFNEITIGTIYVPRVPGQSKNGYVLQSYAPDKATFLPPPRFNKLACNALPIDPNPGFRFVGQDPPILETIDMIFTAPVEANEQFIVLDEDDSSIFEINENGLYLVTFKISFNKSLGYMRAYLNNLDEFGVPIRIRISESDIPNINFSPASGYYSTISSAFCMRINAGDLFTLSIDYVTSATNENNFRLVQNIEGEAVNSITFTRIGE